MLAAPFAVHAGATLEFATFLIPMHVESDSKGLFIDLVHEMARRTGTTVHINVLPPSRAIDGFVHGNYDALFPAFDLNFASGHPAARTKESIDCKEDFVFTRKGAPFLKTLKDLEGKRVGITRGYPYAPEIMVHPGLKFESAKSDEVNIEKLIAGRVNAFILDEKTGIKAFEAKGLLPVMQYDANQSVSRLDVYVAFHAQPAGQALADRFSQALAAMKSDGTYQRITRGVTIGGGCARH